MKGKCQTDHILHTFQIGGDVQVNGKHKIAALAWEEQIRLIAWGVSMGSGTALRPVKIRKEK